MEIKKILKVLGGGGSLGACVSSSPILHFRLDHGIGLDNYPQIHFISGLVFAECFGKLLVITDK